MNNIQEHIRQFQTGNKDAFTCILNRYKSPVVHFAYRYLGNRDDAEDAAQEIFVKIYRALPAYKPAGKFPTWLFTIAARHCSNIRRRKKILSFFSLDDLIHHPSSRTEHHRSALQNAVHSALNKLPDKQKTAVLLSKFEHMPLEKIASVLGVTTGSVKQLIFRAKTTLQKLLKEYTP